MKGDWYGNCIYCGSPLYEGYRHHCRMEDGIMKCCECDEEISPYPCCEQCPWSDELEEEEAKK